MYYDILNSIITDLFIFLIMFYLHLSFDFYHSCQKVEYVFKNKFFFKK